jgi:hypothetical protein
MHVNDYYVDVYLTLYDHYNGVLVGNLKVRMVIYDEKDYNNLLNLIAMATIQSLARIHFTSSDVRAYKRIEDITRRLFAKFEVVKDRVIMVDIKNKEST